MNSLVLGSVPSFGHVSPVTRLAAELCGLGHRVRFVTGARQIPGGERRR